MLGSIICNVEGINSRDDEAHVAVVVVGLGSELPRLHHQRLSLKSATRDSRNLLYQHTVDDIFGVMQHSIMLVVGLRE